MTISHNLALGSRLISSVRYQSGSNGTMQLQAEGDNNKVVACIVEIDKR